MISFIRLPMLRARSKGDRKSTRLNSSHTEIYTLSLHDALPISKIWARLTDKNTQRPIAIALDDIVYSAPNVAGKIEGRSEEHTSELQSHRDLHSFPTRRSSDLQDMGQAYR